MIVPLLTYSSIITLNLCPTQRLRVEDLQKRGVKIIKLNTTSQLHLPDIINQRV